MTREEYKINIEVFLKLSQAIHILRGNKDKKTAIDLISSARQLVDDMMGKRDDNLEIAPGQALGQCE